jgi:hypothetical protein
MSRSETRRIRDCYTAGQDLLIKRMTTRGCPPAEIAEAVGKTAKQVLARAFFLKNGKSAAQIKKMGWPVPDPFRLHDWGPGFWNQNVTEKPGKTARMLQSPVTQTLGGVGKYQ